MNDFNISIPYCCLINVRVSAESIDDESQEFELAVECLDEMEPILQFRDSSGESIREDRVSIAEGRYTKNLIYSDGFRFRHYRIGSEPAAPACDDEPGVAAIAVSLDAGKSKLGTLRSCSVVYTERGEIIEVVDGDLHEKRPQYKDIKYLGTFKTTVAEYRRLVKNFQRRN